MSTTTELVTLASGRRVAVRTLAQGAPGSRTLVICHPAPGSGAFDPDPAQTARRDISLIAVDRPGYGGSDPVEPGLWADVASAAADLAEVLMQRGDGPVGVAGWSAGGRVALALAARHPELVDRVAVVGTPAPHEEVPWIPEEHAAGLEAMRGLPPEQVHGILAGMFAVMVPGDAPAGSDDARADESLAMLGAGEADVAALAMPGARDRLLAMLAQAFSQGAAGMASDLAGYTLRPMGFDSGEVQAKTLLLYGAADSIGSRHARWWQQRLPDARTEMVPEAGHLLLIPMWDRVLSHLAPGKLRSGGVGGAGGAWSPSADGAGSEARTEAAAQQQVGQQPKRADHEREEEDRRHQPWGGLAVVTV